MDIMVSELFEYILGHNTHILGNWHTYYLDKGYCIKVNDDKHYNNMKFIKNGRVVKRLLTVTPYYLKDSVVSIVLLITMRKL
ncbi:hypothetical protein Remus_197 [Silviavirus remus]|uniref:Uncharacterized protein n=1 Tax=Silviavirus remus TaxID=1857890 RepID=A0A8E5KD04_9CAUD|nr:hypothetical protein Remus_197 [Silviavirus remus]